MNTKKRTTRFLFTGSAFALLSTLLFLSYTHFKTSDTPCNAFGWLLSDHAELIQIEEHPFLLILSALCGFLFSIYFGAYVIHQLPGTMNEAAGVLIALKFLSLISVLFYSFNQSSLFFFIVNGLVVILSIFTYFIFSLIFRKLRLPLYSRFIPFFCFVYSMFSFFILALAPTIDPANIQLTSNFLDLLFILSLSWMMWKIKKLETAGSSGFEFFYFLRCKNSLSKRVERLKIRILFFLYRRVQQKCI